MKFNWGTGIFLFFTFFAVSMISAVVASTNHKPVLVQDDYYQLDIDYQKRLDAKQNAATLSSAPKIMYIASSSSVSLRMPEGQVIKKGTLRFLKTTDAKQDFSIELTPTTPIDNMPIQTLTNGRWRVEFDWFDGEKDYFYTQLVK